MPAELRRRIGSAPEIVRLGFGQKLECDGLPEFKINRAIHFAHAAPAKQPDNSIPPATIVPGGNRPSSTEFEEIPRKGMACVGD